MIREFFALSAARYLSAILGILRALLIPRFLSPGIYGVYKTYQMVSELSRIGTLGILSALFRELPIAISRGDLSRKRLLLGNGFWATIGSVIPLAAALLIGGTAGWIHFEDVPLSRWFLLFIPLLFVDRLRVFFDVVFNGQKQFVLLAKLRGLDEMLATVVYVGATWKFGFPGLLVGAVLVNSLLAYLYWRGSGFRMGSRFDVGLAKQMAAVGFPHLLNGLGNTIYSQLDRMVILGGLGLSAMGFYSVGATLVTQMIAASQIIGRILTPRMMERFSEREEIQDLRAVFIPPMRLASQAYAPAVILGAIAGEPIFKVVLPTYEPGLLPFQIVILGAFFPAIWSAVHPFFLAINKQWNLLLIYLTTIPLALGLNLLALRLGLGLPGIALATAVTHFGFVTVVILVALRNFLPVVWDRLVEVAKIYAPLVPAVTIWGVAHAVRDGLGLMDQPLAGALAEGAVFAGIYGAYAGMLAWTVGYRRVLGMEVEGE